MRLTAHAACIGEIRNNEKFNIKILMGHYFIYLSYKTVVSSSEYLAPNG
jgi:hypothetical protein